MCKRKAQQKTEHRGRTRSRSALRWFEFTIPDPRRKTSIRRVPRLAGFGILENTDAKSSAANRGADFVFGDGAWAIGKPRSLLHEAHSPDSGELPKRFASSFFVGFRVHIWNREIQFLQGERFVTHVAGL